MTMKKNDFNSVPAAYENEDRDAILATKTTLTASTSLESAQLSSDLPMPTLNIETSTLPNIMESQDFDDAPVSPPTGPKITLSDSFRSSDTSSSSFRSSGSAKSSYRESPSGRPKKTLSSSFRSNGSAKSSYRGSPSGRPRKTLSTSFRSNGSVKSSYRESPSGRPRKTLSSSFRSNGSAKSSYRGSPVASRRQVAQPLRRSEKASVSCRIDPSLEFESLIIQQQDSQKKNRNIESLTINNLNYDLGVVGRTQEIGEMRACLRRMILLSQSTGYSAISLSDFTEAMLEQEDETKVSTTFKELIWLRGYSGAGKSTLVDHLENSVTNNPNGMMVRGKFDVKGSDQPYSGILEAFGAIFKKFAGTDGKQASQSISVRSSVLGTRTPGDRNKMKTQNGSNEKNLQIMRREIAAALKMELGDELQLLLKLVPYLDNVVNRNKRPLKHSSSKALVNDGGNGSGMSDGFGAGQKRIKFVFRILMRVVSSYFSPLVVVLDDLQWSDVGSLELLDYLISDKHNVNSLMIIGSYRSNEVDDTHILTHAKRALNKKMVQCQFHVTNVEVGNFRPTDVNRVIMKMLGIDDPDVTKGLAHICFNRTLGNPYFIVQFVTMLKEEGLLEFNLGLLKWVWDEDTIENFTVSTDNVVQILQARMIKLDADLLLALQYAACLGSSFDRYALEMIWTSHSGISLTDVSPDGVDLIGNILLSLCSKKYMERLDEYNYRWVHDEVQEAALSLIGSSKPRFQFDIGCILYNNLVEEDMEDSLFTVVDLINSMEIKRRPEFAYLNLRAALKAKEISAFASAAMYVSHGVQRLPSDKWRDKRQLTLRLYTLGAEMELAIGNVEVMKEYYHEAMAQCDATTMERLPLYIVKLHKLFSIDLQYKEAIDFNLKILKRFGCDLVWKWNPQTIKAQAIQKVVQTRKILNQVPSEFYERQREMIDPRRKAIMLLLSKLLYSCYVAHEHSIWVLCVTKMVRMTLKYGVHDASGSSFVAVSALLREFYESGNEALSLAETGLKLQSRVENQYSVAMTQYLSQSFVFAWRKPLITCEVPYMEGFISGMRSGNIEFGLWCLVNHHIVIAHHLGKPLSLMLARFPNCLHQMEDMKQQLQTYFVKVQWQMMINLQGEGGKTTELKGEIFDMESLPPLSAMEESFVYFAQLELYIYYGDYEAAAFMVTENGEKFESNCIGDSYSQIEMFHRGLALFAVARKTKKRKHKQRAKKVRATIEEWAKEGNPNVDHFLTLLNAEYAAFKNKPAKAEEFYKSAIIKAARPGRSQDAALFSERYADFLRQPIEYCVGLEDEARYRTQEAIRYYTEWGALKKASMLEQSLNDIQSQ